MSGLLRIIVTLSVVWFAAGSLQAEERAIDHEELVDKLYGFWIGQILGNYIGFPFENRYIEEPVHVFVDHVYTAKYDGAPPTRARL